MGKNINTVRKDNSKVYVRKKGEREEAGKGEISDGTPKRFGTVDDRGGTTRGFLDWEGEGALAGEVGR